MKIKVAHYPKKMPYKIPDLQVKVRLHALSIDGSISRLPDDRELTAKDTDPIIKEARVLMAAAQQLHDLVSGVRPPIPPTIES